MTHFGVCLWRYTKAGADSRANINEETCKRMKTRQPRFEIFRATILALSLAGLFMVACGGNEPTESRPITASFEVNKPRAPIGSPIEITYSRHRRRLRADLERLYRLRSLSGLPQRPAFHRRPSARNIHERMEGRIEGRI